MSWKLKWINRSEFDSIKCSDEYKYYSITDNSACNYKQSYLKTLLDYTYINRKGVKENNHFE